MKTNVQQSSIDTFYGRVQADSSEQRRIILSKMEAGKEYTGQQLYHMTGFVPGTISARLSELREKKSVVRSEGRTKCPISGESVYTHHKVVTMPTEQLELVA